MGHKMDQKLAATHHHHHHNSHHHVGNKVLPINEANVSALITAGLRTSAIITSTSSTQQDDHQKKKDNKVPKSGSASTTSTGTDTNKIKAITRMKLELLRWAAAAKQQSSHEKGASTPKTPSFLSRKVAYFRNRGNAIRAIRSSSSTTGIDDITDDIGSISSPKISFKWDVVSSCSAYSTMSLPCPSTSRINYSEGRLSTRETMLALPAAADDDNNNQLCPSRFGNWITTDDEFVVLEL